MLAKTPLILEPGIYFYDPHTVLPVGLNFTSIEMALLPFRFTAALTQKIARVMAHRGHVQGSIDDYQKMGIKLE
jgi:hypothetical protein